MLTELRAERSEACLSDLTFDAWRAGELDADQRNAAEAHVSDCQRCRERQHQLQVAAQAFLERFPTLAQRSEGFRTRPQRRRGVALTAWGAGLAMAAALVLFVGVRSRTPLPQATESGTRIKGGDRVGFFVRRSGSVFEGSDGQRVLPGDQLRFTVSTRETRHVAILSRDPKGLASVYYPATAARSRLLTSAQSGPLESAVELDESLGREQIFGVFCQAAFDLEPLRAKLEREAKLVAPPGCSVDRLELVKERAE